ncbi:heavy metal translocating P-type ATPase [Dysgonomonas sp. BGC7]|uniref:heavy metal translocating P-type ATPase n=1 Tax=Dysgonomonas sp. BGC7 TaxID=1658008 RepID=UPI00067FA758|nr:heavy metal translocating P-type ATPase [Dysgonomonas sp. BGC7]MBD8387651.1 cadmium-translocating P-type ATPase [Dysgonomonas sp. BGC7]
MDNNKQCKCTSCDSIESQVSENNWRQYIPISISLLMLLIGLVMDNFFSEIFSRYLRLGWYLVAYIPVAFPVFKEALEMIKEKDFFTEFTLMGIATLGAFIIGEYPEGVAVMVFYTIGELFQDSAVNKAKRNIKALLDVRPDTATVYRNDSCQTISPEKVGIDEVIQVKAGEKVPLDGIMLASSASFNTAALTGESKPKTISAGETVLAGMLNLDKVIEVKVTKKYQDSSLARILEMVQDATSRKAKTELLIRKFAKIYTPIVFLLALLITAIPYFVVSDYIFSEWLSRALVFLVISCPCALVVSIPLGYFGGIGAASKAGILFKGANYLDLMTKVNTVVMDKTGTLTKGVFNVQKVVSVDESKQEEFVAIVAAIEKFSNHPIAKAIVQFAKISNNYTATDVEEISGHGLKGNVNGEEVLVGNAKLMQKFNISYDRTIESIVETIVIAAIDGKYVGYITIADEVKDDAQTAISDIHAQGIKQVVMLSGDKSSITNNVASSLGIDSAYGDLLPEDKVHHIEELKREKNNIIAFVGDGINDAPSLALSDVGIAMGGMGSDAAIEVADVIIQTDQPSKIATSIKIAKATRQVVIQNIVLAFSVKLIVLILGGFGLATMWEAVFADVGVSLLAILNAVRILKMRF